MEKKILRNTVAVIFIVLAFLNVITGAWSFRHLGKVQDKVYLAIGIQGNWASSKALCEGVNMKLGSIETAEEHDFLRSSYKAGEFNGWYWTAARESGNRSLVWDTTGESTMESLNFATNITGALKPTDFLVCGGFYVNATWSSMVYMRCDDPDGYVLCEA